MKIKNLLSVVSTTVLVTMIVGCGSNPSNCLTDTEIGNYMSANGINDCATAGCAYPGSATALNPNGSTTIYNVCAAKGNSSCGSPPTGSTCNMNVEIVLADFTYDCVYPWGTSGPNNCSSLYLWNVLNTPCVPGSTSTPSQCALETPAPG